MRYKGFVSSPLPQDRGLGEQHCSHGSPDRRGRGYTAVQTSRRAPTSNTLVTQTTYPNFWQNMVTERKYTREAERTSDFGMRKRSSQHLSPTVLKPGQTAALLRNSPVSSWYLVPRGEWSKSGPGEAKGHREEEKSPSVSRPRGKGL